ncbi:hypothetical protein RHMOL_Rhmol01G0194900 [Rhododendron molle]|uniref:Uncharacterized protein n=1 Tax=Rhododendron molle TaxID=49168 RepID=A0ACC0Q2X3_RHOML|nr:hypothetical protein RHMOL_Rhmol01G0194900 [Rhododendron molle]
MHPIKWNPKDPFFLQFSPSKKSSKGLLAHDSIMKTKTTTAFFLVLFVTLLLILGPLQAADAEKANYRRLLSDDWNFGQDASSTDGKDTHRYTVNENPPASWDKKKDNQGRP